MERLNLPNPQETRRKNDVVEPSSDRQPPIGDPLEDIRTRVRQLEADLDWLGEEVKRLRGRVTGGLRRAREEPEPPTTAALSLDQINAAIRAGTFRRG